jgi:hypothetical protein
MVIATAASRDSHAPLPPPTSPAMTTRPANPTAKPNAARMPAGSPNSQYAGSKISSGWALASTAATPTLAPATPANMNPNPKVALKKPNAAIVAHNCSVGDGLGRVGRPRSRA